MATEKFVLKILGTGCAKCNKLADNTQAAAEELGLDYEMVKVTDMMEIVKLGVIQTPGLIVNDKIAITGKSASQDEVKDILAKFI